MLHLYDVVTTSFYLKRFSDALLASFSIFSVENTQFGTVVV